MFKRDSVPPATAEPSKVVRRSVVELAAEDAILSVEVKAIDKSNNRVNLFFGDAGTCYDGLKLQGRIWSG